MIPVDSKCLYKFRGNYFSLISKTGLPSPLGICDLGLIYTSWSHLKRIMGHELKFLGWFLPFSSPAHQISTATTHTLSRFTRYILWHQTVNLQVHWVSVYLQIKAICISFRWQWDVLPKVRKCELSEGSHTQLSLRRQEGASCLKQRITSHFLKPNHLDFLPEH